MKKVFILGIVLCLFMVSIGYSDTTRVNTAVSTSISTNQKTITTSATKIVDANSIRKSILLRNIGSVDIYIGVSTVTTSTGFLLKVNESMALDRNTAAIYGVVLSGSGSIALLEE